MLKCMNSFPISYTLMRMKLGKFPRLLIIIHYKNTKFTTIKRTLSLVQIYRTKEPPDNLPTRDNSKANTIQKKTTNT